MEATWRAQTEALGAFIRAQRQMADLSLREMATLTDVSNAYLSQIERGLHQPSVRVLSAIARALDVPPDALLAQAGLTGTPAPPAEGAAAPGENDHVCSVEDAIRRDSRLTDLQRRAMMEVYRSFTSPGA